MPACSAAATGARRASGGDDAVLLEHLGERSHVRRQYRRVRLLGGALGLLPPAPRRDRASAHASLAELVEFARVAPRRLVGYRRRVKVAGLVLAVFAVVTLVWIGGEHHRENCIRSGRIDCSVLPWQAGKAKPKAARRAPGGYTAPGGGFGGGGFGNGIGGP